MANTYYNLLAHIVFAVKNRDAWIPMEMLPEFHRYIGGLISRHDSRCRALAVGGIHDHVHILLSYNPAIALSRLVQDIKVSANYFLNDRPECRRKFEWQKGFACISVSPSHVENVRGYINRQMEHHRGRTMSEEITGMLRRAGIEYDDAYIFEET